MTAAAGDWAAAVDGMFEEEAAKAFDRPDADAARAAATRRSTAGVMRATPASAT